MFSNVHKFIGHLVDDELSYTITRSYPYGKTFKIWVFIVTIPVLVGLTVLNLATNGFDKQLSYTSDPNTTVAQLHWYNNKIFTWGDDTLEPKCQNVDMPIGHEFLTTNLGLRYTIRKIEAQDGKPRTSVSYHNNTLTDCELDNIGISLINSGFANPSREYRWTPWVQSTADAVAHCNISTEDGPLRLEFRTEYKTFIESFEFIAMDDPKGHASLWWGSRLMNTYFVGTQYVMSGPLPDTNADTPIYTRARLSYEIERGSITPSIRDPLLFNNWFYFLRADTGIRETVEDSGLTTSMLYNNASYYKSRPQTEGLFFAKIFRSAILTDLGNTRTENLLLDQDLLQYALNPGHDNFNRIPGAPLGYNTTNSEWWKFGSIAPPGERPSAKTGVPFEKAYTQLKDELGELGTNPATINAVYTCSIPAKKSTSTMFLFTLVANISLFQVIWGVFKHVLDQKTTWKNQRANYCEGCAREYEDSGTHDSEYSPVSPHREKPSPSIGSSSTRALLGGEDDYPTS